MKKVIFFLLIFITFTACDPILSLFQPLIGTWENSSTELNFMPFGFEEKQRFPDGYTSYNGNYITHDNQLKLVYTDEETNFTYQIQDSILYLMDDQGNSIILKKK